MQMSVWQRWRLKAYLFVAAIHRRMTLGTRAALVDGNKVFLIRHTYVPGWQFPGGGVEPGETAEQSAAREALEETGYRVTGPMRLIGFYHNDGGVTNRDHIAFYVGETFEMDHAFKANMEIAEAGWFDIADLPEGVTPGTLRRIGEVFHGVAVSAKW